MMDETLRRLQLTQLEMLKVFDRFCREHELKYSLYAGTLLGAVRHQAFIPWDDDLDVCMERAEYNSFVSLWEHDPQPGYILQNKENSPMFTQSFTKLRKDHTTFLQSEKEIGRYHTGIFIDIFPIDRIPNGKTARARFTWCCLLYQLLMREFAPPKGNALIRIGSEVLLCCIPKHRREKARQRLLKKITQYNDLHGLETVAIETAASMRKLLPTNLLDEYVDLPFENGKYMCFAEWDEYLRRKFGDYRQLPPEDDRVWKHHPERIDFEHNIEELTLEPGN